MTLFAGWRQKRRTHQERRVLHAINMLKPEQASGWPISRLAGLGPAGAYPILARLERTGVVTSDWVDGPSPRRRVYRAAKEAQ